GDTPDDEDGVTLSTLYAGATATISVTVSEPTGVDGMLQGWFDWNGDGDWDDAGEQVLTDQAVVNGANTFAVDILPASGVYTTYARFRLSSSSGITMAGVADDGEVEDYFVTFDFLQDFGDAPDSYLTTLAANGPRHILSNPADNPVRLGAAVTAESDANTPLDATGDASDDGVASFPTLLTTDTSYTLAVNVTNSSGSAGNLIGWIDFNGNGVFEAGEAAVTTVPDGTNGGTVALTWSGLSGLPAGDTYARLRLTTDAAITTSTPGGPAADGEVEDYPLEIITPPFTCSDGTAFLFQGLTTDPTDVYSIDLQSGAATLIASDLTTAPDTINGIGYNQLDNYIWGSVIAQSQIVRVGADYVPKYFTIPGLPTDMLVGDVSPDGKLYLTSSSFGSLRIIDLDPNSPDYLTLKTVAATTTSSYPIYDWAFSPIDGQLYAVTSTARDQPAPYLRRINPVTGALTNLGAIAGTQINQENSHFGAVYFTAEGDFYVSANTSGKIYHIVRPDLISAGNASATYFSQGPASVGNDGARCAGAPFATPLLVSTKTVTDADSDGVAEPAEILTYSIVVTNTGSSNATNVVITDTIPANSTYVAGSADNGGTLNGS
ncbi:MAG: DUF11 domain-containing protein, partial [Caldilineaceae bacterium]|nr:DUF11 domain-containing protein [Caldilineaceae bacterium]